MGVIPPVGIEGLIQSVLPLGAVTDDDTYPYFTGGTCFLLRNHGRLWLVTARHALDDKLVRDLCIPWNLDTHDLLPLSQMIEPRSRDPEDTAFADITIFGVRKTHDPAPAHVSIDVDSINWVSTFSDVLPGDEVMFAGFPRESLKNDVDYDSMTIIRQRFVAHADYVARDTSRGLHRIQVRDMGKVTTLQGMSGSPVFLRRKGARGWSFAGVLVRGNDAGLAHFIEAGVPLALTRACVRADRNRSKRLRRSR